MKIVTLIALAFLVPFVSADPAAQTGEQTGRYWGQSTFVAAQGGTNFVLAGAIGDHDVFFYDANGGYLGGSIACGPDAGVVPAGATVAEIVPWDHVGGVVPACLAPADPVPSSTWVYVDGL